MKDERMFKFVVLRDLNSPQYLLKTVLTLKRIVVESDSISC